MMSEEGQRFVEERDALLTLKVGETARSVAEDLVRVMELLAIHGESGIAADRLRRETYIHTLETRIRSAM